MVHSAVIIPFMCILVSGKCGEQLATRNLMLADCKRAFAGSECPALVASNELHTRFITVMEIWFGSRMTWMIFVLQ